MNPKLTVPVMSLAAFAVAAASVVSAALPGSQLRLLTSAGGLASAESFCGKDSILSGPAGGVVGFSRVAQAAGFAQGVRSHACQALNPNKVYIIH